MRRIVLCGLLALSGCTGMGHFLADTHTFTANPNKPDGDGSNMQRAEGTAGQLAVVSPEPGNVWPTSIPAMPTLAEIQKQMDMTGPGTPLGGVPSNTPGPVRGLGTLPSAGTAVPGLPAAGAGGALPNVPRVTGQNPSGGATPDVMPKLGTSIQTPSGATTITGGTANYQTVAPIGGQSGGILIPNGNGTSTLVMPNGTISTIQSPR